VMLRTIAAWRDDGDKIVVFVLVFASLEVFFGTTNVECCSSQNIMLLIGIVWWVGLSQFVRRFGQYI